jgi:hypothetical protein
MQFYFWLMGMIMVAKLKIGTQTRGYEIKFDLLSIIYYPKNYKITTQKR